MQYTKGIYIVYNEHNRIIMYAIYMGNNWGNNNVYNKHVRQNLTKFNIIRHNNKKIVE